MSGRETRYEIRDADGVIVAAHVRVDHAHKKSFRWELPDGTPSLNGTRLEDLPLYGSEDVRSWPTDEPIFLVEGEKACSALRAHGFKAVGTVTGAACCPGRGALDVLRGRHVIQWADADEVGRKHMATIAEHLVGVAASVSIFEWSGAPEHGDAFDYLAEAESTVRLHEDLKSSKPWTPSTPKPPHVVATGARRRVQGTELALDDPEAWTEPIDGFALFSEIVATINRFVVLPRGAVFAITLWIALTYLTDVVDVLPRLLLASPTKSCGKTRLLGLLGGLVRRPLLASSISPSAAFRVIEASAPTLLLDEMDNSRIDENSELRAVLNSGHTRATAFALRSVGDQFEPRRFTTWAPVAFAAIGKLPDTVSSRCVRIPMRRRKPTEIVERLRESRIHAELDPLRRKLTRWSQDHTEVGGADPQIPEGLSDRDADNWSPLLAIADAVGGDWPRCARLAAQELCGTPEDDEAPSVLILADLRDLFAERRVDRLSSEEIVSALARLDGRPWPEWRDGKPITNRGVARLLKPFGIEPNSVRFPDGTRKGYVRDQLSDAWSRYLPKHPEQPEQAANDAAATPFIDPEQGSHVPDGDGPSNPHERCSVPHVPDTGGARPCAIEPEARS